MRPTVDIQFVTTDASARAFAEAYAAENDVDSVVVNYPTLDHSRRTLDWSPWEWSIRTVLVHAR